MNIIMYMKNGTSVVIFTYINILHVELLSKVKRLFSYVYFVFVCLFVHHAKINILNYSVQVCWEKSLYYVVFFFCFFCFVLFCIVLRLVTIDSKSHRSMTMSSAGSTDFGSIPSLLVTMKRCHRCLYLLIFPCLCPCLCHNSPRNSL